MQKVSGCQECILRLDFPKNILIEYLYYYYKVYPVITLHLVL